jgi:hypothetical protein
VRRLLASDKESLERPPKEALVLCLLAVAGMFALSVVATSNGNRLDHAVYGRYNEIFIPSLLVAGLGWVMRTGAQSQGQVLIAGSTVLALAPAVSWVLAARAGSELMPLTVLGILPFSAESPPILSGTMSAFSAACVLVLAVVLRWRVRVALVVLAVAALWATFHVDREFIKPLVTGFPRQFALQDWIAVLPGNSAIGYDVATARGMNIHSYQFRLSRREAVLFDSTLEKPPSSLVVASLDWNHGAKESGARLVAAEGLNNHGLWITPGLLLDKLRASGVTRRWEGEALPTGVDSEIGDDAQSSDGRYRALSLQENSREHPAVLMFGPYIGLAPGAYETRFRVAWSPTARMILQVTADRGERLLVERSLWGRGKGESSDFETIALRLLVDEPAQAVEFRVLVLGSGRVAVDFVETTFKLDAEPNADVLGR